MAVLKSLHVTSTPVGTCTCQGCCISKSQVKVWDRVKTIVLSRLCGLEIYNAVDSDLQGGFMLPDSEGK